MSNELGSEDISDFKVIRQIAIRVLISDSN